MEKEALEYAVGLAEPHIEEIDGKVYSDKILRRIAYNPNPRLHRYNKIRYMHNLGKWQHIALPKRPPTKGETLAKAMVTMEKEYGVRFLFCHPVQAGAKVVGLLEGGCDDDRRAKVAG